MNLASNECLSHVAGQVIQDVCLERSAELWVEHLTPNVGPYFALSSLDFAGDCLATFNSSGADSTDVVIANCNYDNQSDPTWIRQVWSLG